MRPKYGPSPLLQVWRVFVDLLQASFWPSISVALERSVSSAFGHLDLISSASRLATVRPDPIPKLVGYLGWVSSPTTLKAILGDFLPSAQFC